MQQTQFGGKLFPPLAGQIDGPIHPGLPFFLRLPTGLDDRRQGFAGRYFLARCSSEVGVEREGDWSIFLRRPLFICGRQPQGQYDRWQLYLPTGPEQTAQTSTRTGLEQQSADTGFGWLARRSTGDLINLVGPCGNGFSIIDRPHNLLLLVDYADSSGWFWKLLSLCEQTLDRGGQVTILLRTADDETVPALVPWLPVQVEVRSATDKDGWLESIHQTAGWADSICAGAPASLYSDLSRVVRQSRFQTDRNLVQVLVQSDLLCGVGACLVCAIPTLRGGTTRTCMHGPVFDLANLAE